MTRSAEDLSHHRSGRARRAVTGVLWSGVNTLVPALSGLVVFTLVSRAIAPAELGYVSLAVAVVSTLSALSPAGFGDALVQRSDLDERHLDATFWLCLGWGVALYVLSVLFVRPLAALLQEPMLVSLLPVVGLRLIIDLANVVPSALLSRAMRFRPMALRTLIASLLSMIICLGMLLAGHGIWALVASQIVGALVVCVVSWLAVRWRPRLSFDSQALREMAGFGGYASGSRLISGINVDQLLIGPLVGSAGLGLYWFARRISQMVNDVLTGALAGVAYPLLSSMQDEPEKLREAYLATTFLSSVMAFPCFIGLALIADDMVPLLFGDQWREGVPVLQLFCLIGLLSCIGILQAALIRAKGKANWWMWYQLIQQGVTVIAILLLWRLGVVAVTAGIAAKAWLTAPFMSVLAARLLGLSLRSYLAQFLSPLIGTVVMAAALQMMNSHGVTNGAAGLVLQIVVGATVYSATVLMLSGRRLRLLRSALKSR